MKRILDLLSLFQNILNLLAAGKDGVLDTDMEAAANLSYDTFIPASKPSIYKSTGNSLIFAFRT